MIGHYHYQSEEYCEECLPVPCNHDDVDLDYLEQDSPANCCVCHKPLDYKLTSIGINYVIESIREELNDPDRFKMHVSYKGTWYDGSLHLAIVRDWAETIKDYYLSEADRELVNKIIDEHDEYYLYHGGN